MSHLLLMNLFCMKNIWYLIYLGLAQMPCQSFYMLLTVTATTNVIYHCSNLGEKSCLRVIAGANFQVSGRSRCPK